MSQLALDLPLVPLPTMRRGPWYFVPWLLCAGLDWNHPLARATYDARHVELAERLERGELQKSSHYRFRAPQQTVITSEYPLRRVMKSGNAGFSACLLVRRAV